VQSRLREAILTARLRPGAAVSEHDIVQMLGVSRTPIREALQRLANEGLVEVRPKIGTFVARMDLDRIREALLMREAIECTMLRRLPVALGRGDVRALERIVSGHRRAVRVGDLPAIMAADDAFHRMLLDLAQVPGMWRYVREAREMHRRVRVLSRAESDSARRSVTQHAAVVAALGAGQRAKAVELLRGHIRMNAHLAEEMARKHPEYFYPVPS